MGVIQKIMMLIFVFFCFHCREHMTSCYRKEGNILNFGICNFTARGTPKPKKAVPTASLD